MTFDFQLSQIKTVAEQLWKQNKQYKIWAFHAPMGAGKTTLIHALCDVLKVTRVVSSPTFTIINEYQSSTAGIIYHMDWYRLKDKMEIIQSGCEDCIESGNICFIEWSEKAPDLLPQKSLQINLEIVNEFERRLIAKPLNN